MQGLQKLDMESLEITLLATEAPTDAPEGQRRPIRYANDLAIASDGSIYFTDSADIGPALNAAGFYDTMIGYLQIRAQVWLLTGSLLWLFSGTASYANAMSVADLTHGMKFTS